MMNDAVRKAGATLAGLAVLPRSLRRLVEQAAIYEGQRVMMEEAVKSLHERNIVDAEGYVRLEALLEVARSFSNPSAFLNTVSACLVTPQRCQCWWCKAKRCVGRLLYRVRRAAR